MFDVIIFRVVSFLSLTLFHDVVSTNLFQMFGYLSPFSLLFLDRIQTKQNKTKKKRIDKAPGKRKKERATISIYTGDRHTYINIEIKRKKSRP